MRTAKVNYSQACPWQWWVLARDGGLKELFSPLKILARLPHGLLTLFLSINCKDGGQARRPALFEVPTN